MLILGDQVYQQPAADLKKELKGKVKSITRATNPVWSGTLPRRWNFSTAILVKVNGISSTLTVV